MKGFAKHLLAIGIVAAVAASAFAQVPTGTVSGHVTDGKDALPGVAVTVTSPNLQGSRTAVASISGDYILTFLPPGEYHVRFELQGFQTLETTVKVSAAQTARLDAVMPQSKVTEEVTVSGSYETISSSQQAATTFDTKLVSKLPVLNRTAGGYGAYIALAPAVTQNGPTAGLTIAGSNSYENLFLVNGVVVNENLRGQPTSLFIEDAIEETTTSVSSVSAEYGRFAGGVVNTLTKSGGNRFSASARLTVNNNYWSEPTPLTTASNRKNLDLNTYEGTLGGFAVKDRLWFFGAYRKSDQSTPATAYGTRIPYNTAIAETRWEGKLTFSPAAEHRLVGSYIKRDRSWSNYVFVRTPDPAETGINRSIPETLTALNYAGVLTNNFFVEGQYSKRTLEFVGSGSRYTDRIKGTVIGWPLSWWDNAFVFAASPVFCAVCGNETRDNKNYVLKASWFLTTATLGSHDIRLGVDRFDDLRLSNNHQSGSDFAAGATSYRIDGTHYYPVFRSGASSFAWLPIFSLSRGNNFRTDSLFANDAWRLNNNFSFNVGVRYDKNNGTDASGRTTANDSNISPRVGVTWDPNGAGEWQVMASYGKYVAAIANAIGDSAGGGVPSVFEWVYTGPDINTSGPYVDSYEALRQLFAWFDAQGGAAGLFAKGQPFMRAPAVAATGLIVFPKSLNSTNVEEVTVGFSRRLGNRGLIRVDAIKRRWSDFYATQVDQSTGTATTPYAPGMVFDRTNIVNTNLLNRRYDAIMVQGQYRFADWLNVGGNYTWSHAYGNSFLTENAGSGPLADTVLSYPEYFQMRWYRPEGDLPIDQRHRARVYGVVDILNSKHNRLSASLMHSYSSGQPYGAYGNILISDYVTNPGYKTPPSSVTYWFTKPDAYRLPSVQSTDLSLNYSFVIPGLGDGVQLFLEPRVTNVFNRMSIASADPQYFNTQATTANDDPSLQPFNPFTETPVAGVNYTYEPGATSRVAYQQGRTYYFSVGIRF